MELIFYFALFPKDIHYLALDKGESALAEVARKRASDIDTESITSGVGKNSCWGFLSAFCFNQYFFIIISVYVFRAWLVNLNYFLCKDSVFKKRIKPG